MTVKRECSNPGAVLWTAQGQVPVDVKRTCNWPGAILGYGLDELRGSANLDLDYQILQWVAHAGMDVPVLSVRLAQAGVGWLEHTSR
jgi:hypothetical protein